MGDQGVEQLQNCLGNLPLPDRDNFRPEFFRPEDRRALLELIDHKRPVLHDEMASQVRELIKIRNPRENLSEGDLQRKYEEWLLTHNPAVYGVYVYYPWSNKLLHIVDREEFIELRTSRNKYKISAEEQEVLASKKIGIIGLSVGQSVAMTLATERVGGTLRIADFDRLELTNLNRIRTGVASLGLEKTTMVAREIAELDPFLKVEVYGEGINPENIDEFLQENGKLDLLIEVCDSLPIKILSRLRARQFEIPVIMDTSDRGMIDVERFDQDPQQPILHGKCGVESMEELEIMTREEQMQLLMRMVDFENLSEKMKYSFSELGKTITTWPQLASDVIDGGAMSTKISRRMLLGEGVPSGRYYLDGSEKIISN